MRDWIVISSGSLPNESTLLHGRFLEKFRTSSYIANLLSELVVIHSSLEIYYSGITFPLFLLSFS
ncbi:hypothetical protein [Leptospira licerasiae]|uniref:Uncharacterized protein n=1 Tax=Leptospira licerasiae str. MMD4847 TaxID=1049971 RepID=A0ABN0HAH9_9LEPT|nr:hypothetical protein [Leptospira licerasiae]EIE01586.1 hypothetical protein LEP1GSC185_3195 [Leptospira licerasiae serovar Varillal str. VAR 010]EJZ42694.1 hypothetical protein LEP1GSC178_2814 [Leptospira licerasiae str. MMD4847]